MFLSITVWLCRKILGSAAVSRITRRLTAREPVSTQAIRPATRKTAMPQSTEGSRTVAAVSGRTRVRAATMYVATGPLWSPKSVKKRGRWLPY
ncbi:MAG: hypothetical protein ACLQGJ_11285 [Candidatus Dormibacteria bacterium]